MIAFRHFAWFIVLCLVGCDQRPEPVELVDVELHDRLRSEFVMPTEPESVITLHELYEQLSATDADETPADEEIVVVGQVGGLDDPDDPDHPQARWSRRVAEFRLLDPAGNGEADAAGHAGHHHDDPDHECPFCSAEGPGVQTIVRFMDEQGSVVPVDARVLFRLDGEDLVVVRGRARLEPGTMVIDGTGLHVRR